MSELVAKKNPTILSGCGVCVSDYCFSTLPAVSPQKKKQHKLHEEQGSSMCCSDDVYSVTHSRGSCWMHDSMSTAENSVTCDTESCLFRGDTDYFAAKAAFGQDGLMSRSTGMCESDPTNYSDKFF
jgi:hypothetical protein